MDIIFFRNIFGPKEQSEGEQRSPKPKKEARRETEQNSQKITKETKVITVGVPKQSRGKKNSKPPKPAPNFWQSERGRPRRRKPIE